MQHFYLSSSNGSLSNSSNTTATWNQSRHVDQPSGCLSSDLSFSDKTFLAFFLLFFACVLLFSTANGFLFFLTVRFKQSLWQSQYVLIKSLSACGVGMCSLTGFVVASSLAVGETQTYGIWCVAQFCLLRVFFLTTQMTLALMAAERYVFICYGIHYLRVMSACNARISMGLVWLLSGGLSLHGGLVLSRFRCGFQQKTSGLLCNAFTIKEHITFSQEEGMLLFGPPSVITTFCILTICYCYGRTYRAALRVSVALKCNNHRANRTMGIYFLMFLLQLAPNVSFVIITAMGKRRASACRTVSSVVVPLLIIIPTCINAAFLLVRNPEIKRLFVSSCRAPVTTVVEMLAQNKAGEELEEDGRQVERERRAEGERKAATPPLPGCVFLSISENHSLP